MLFNSYVFIIGFLPIVAAGFFLSRAFFNHWAALAWLTAASIFFYAWWDPRYLWLIGASILFNFLVGRALVAMRPGDRRRTLLLAGIVANLAAIAWFKYAGFVNGAVRAATGHAFALPHIILPLGISFFTFTQIAFLVDCYRRQADEPDLLKYTLFVTYFPHLIAGPIIHHKAVMGQMARPGISLWQSQRIAVGLTIFIFGLVKKVLLADTLAVYPDRIFFLADRGSQPGFVVCWMAALCYALQIYFDFSGYSDMAIGLSRLFGIQLPINFNSPYKSGSIIQFWRRWHISLSRFLRDYLYFSLGGNRHGKFRRHVNLMITMLLGGLWHGAGWTFLIWGALHGVYLVVNHLWRGFRDRLALPFSRAERLAGWGLTFTAILVAWVFFRANSLGAAGIMLRGMSDAGGFLRWMEQVGLHQPHETPLWLPERAVYLSAYTGLVIALFAPNTSQIMARFRPGQPLYERPAPSRWQWHIGPLHAGMAALLLFLSLALVGRPTDFIYFNF